MEREREPKEQENGSLAWRRNRLSGERAKECGREGGKADEGGTMATVICVAHTGRP